MAEGPLRRLPISALVTNRESSAQIPKQGSSDDRAVTMLLQTHHVTVLPSLSWLAKVKPYAGSSNGRVIIGQAENGGLKEPLFRSFQATVDTIKGLWSTPAETTRNRAEYQPTFRPDCS